MTEQQFWAKYLQSRSLEMDATHIVKAEKTLASNARMRSL
jgi:hypothetical protein